MENNSKVTDAAICLHSFIVEYELCSGKRNQNNTYDNKSDDFMNENPRKIVGVVGDKTRETTRGRPTKILKELKKDGKFIQNTLCARIEREGLVRSPTNHYRNVSNLTQLISDNKITCLENIITTLYYTYHPFSSHIVLCILLYVSNPHLIPSH